MIIISALKETYSQSDPAGLGRPDTVEAGIRIRLVINRTGWNLPLLPMPQVDYNAWTDADWKAYIIQCWPNIVQEINQYPQYIDGSVDIDEAWASALVAMFKLTDPQRKNLTKAQIISYVKANL